MLKWLYCGVGGEIKYIFEVNFTCFFYFFKNVAIGALQVTRAAPARGSHGVCRAAFDLAQLLRETEEEKRTWSKR